MCIARRIYRWKAQVERQGLEMLRPRERRRPQMLYQLSVLARAPPNRPSRAPTLRPRHSPPLAQGRSRRAHGDHAGLCGQAGERELQQRVPRGEPAGARRSEVEIGPGDAYVIEPGHDAWVVDERFVGLEFEQRFGGGIRQGLSGRRSGIYGRVGLRPEYGSDSPRRRG